MPELLVQWEHTLATDEASWLPLASVFADAPRAVRSYAKTIRDPAERHALQSLLQ